MFIIYSVFILCIYFKCRVNKNQSIIIRYSKFVADCQIITVLLEFNYKLWIKIKMKKKMVKNCVERIRSDRELWSGACILGTTNPTSR